MSHTTTKIIIARQDGSVLGQYVLGVGEHLIGREIAAAIYIDDPSVSRAHARLFISGDIVEIEDLQSTSGTYVDGVAVRGRIPLEPSQKVHISDLYIDIVREGFRELVAGARLTQGRFTLVRLLGQGGMGAVWLAQDEAQGRQVALKLLPPEMTHDTSGLQDLEREVAKAARFQHANILKIEGLITTEGEPPFILMEYVEGTNLHEVRGQNPDRLMIWSGVRHYMLQLCEALEYAHDQKVAHRDLKPSNLLINPQAELKLADFGIAASIAGTASTLTMGVLEAGTPSYMSPQQVEGRLPQATDDIYSLGATFYDLLTSKPPFYQGDIVHQVLNIPATPIKERLKELNLQNEVPDYVSAMVMACLHKDPAQRPPTVNAVKKWIETKGKADFVAVKQVAWEKTPMPTQAGVAPVAPQAAPKVKSDWLPAAQRRKILAYGAVAAVMAILIGTATWWTGRAKEINGVSVAMQAQLKEGLVAYYPFNGNAKDESGNGNDGEVKGATLTTDRHGNNNSAYGFNGVDDLINVQEKPEFEENVHTISLWFKSNATEGVGSGKILICKDGDGPGRQWQMAEISGLRIKGHVWVPDGMKDIDSTLQYRIGAWCHVMQVWDGRTLKLYVDGVFDSEKPAIGPIESGPAPVLIGGMKAIHTFHGSIDDVRIYNRALSTEESKALYDLEKSEGAPSDLVKGEANRIFDGKSLKGWQSEVTKVWSVEVGALKGSTVQFTPLNPNDKRSLDLTYEKEVGDFELKTKARINRIGNSGIFFRAPVKSGKFDSKLAYEVQIVGSNRNQQISKYMTGALWGHVTTPNLVNDDEWFSLHITANANRIRISVNGREVVDFTDPNPNYPRRGYVKLQMMNTTDAQFREIELTSLD